MEDNVSFKVEMAFFQRKVQIGNKCAGKEGTSRVVQ